MTAFWVELESTGYGPDKSAALYVVGHADVGYPADLPDFYWLGIDSETGSPTADTAFFHAGDFCWPSDEGFSYDGASAHGKKIAQEVTEFAGRFLSHGGSLQPGGVFVTHRAANVATGFLGEKNFYCIGTPVPIASLGGGGGGPVPPGSGTPGPGSPGPAGSPDGGGGPGPGAPPPPPVLGGGDGGGGGGTGDTSETISIGWGPAETPPTVTDVFGDVPYDVTASDGGGGDGGDSTTTSAVKWEVVPRIGEDRPHVIFGWHVFPRNVSEMQILDDGATTVNVLTGVGGTPTPTGVDAAEAWSSTKRYFGGTFVTFPLEPQSSESPGGGDTLFESTNFSYDSPNLNREPSEVSAYWRVFAFPWWGLAHYSAGDAVYHGGRLYVCGGGTNALTAEPPASPWIGRAVPSAITYTATDDVSVALIGKYYDTADFSFAKDLATLKLMVDARLRKFRLGSHIITFTPMPGKTPMPWDDFGIGDTVRVRASERLLGGIPAGVVGAFGKPLDEQRVNGWDLEIDDEDNEILEKIYTEDDQG